jgi:hypothetical protein
MPWPLIIPAWSMQTWATGRWIGRCSPFSRSWCELAAASPSPMAYYSIIHIARERRREVFVEFHRVLAPGGLLMLVFQIGDEQGRRTEFLGTPVSVDWYRQQPGDLTDLLLETGFDMWTTAVREPEGSEKTAQGYILARKPPAKNA